MPKKSKELNGLDRTIYECETMLEFANSNGRSVDGSIQSRLELIKIRRQELVHLEGIKREEARQAHIHYLTATGAAEKMTPEMLQAAADEAAGRAIVRTAAEYTTPIAPGAVSEEQLVEEVGEIHNMLCKVVTPATPSAIMLMEKVKNSRWKFLGPVPFVRRMMVITIFCVLGFIGLFVFPQVSNDSLGTNLLNEPRWDVLLLNELVLIFAAALGASFYALFEAYKYVSKASFDSKYESIYWIRFTLGIVSGIILSQFIFSGSSTEDAINTSTQLLNNQTPSELGGFLTYKPLLAFLGGFSARVVHKILNSLVDSIETFISGSARDMIRARKEAANAQIEDTVKRIKQKNATKDAANRLQSALDLTKLQKQIGEGANTTYINQKIQEMIDGLVTPIGGTSNYNVNLNELPGDDLNNAQNNFDIDPNIMNPPNPGGMMPNHPPTDQNSDINPDAFGPEDMDFGGGTPNVGIDTEGLDTDLPDFNPDDIPDHFGGGDDDLIPPVPPVDNDTPKL
ncbi:MAG: hypothetical protein MK212_16490 [Saprospiraceae bacterium]|nr:hypothetical protein [Saprospiraceae bacterium]